eukprot:Hpha_TRINITY_DN11252_c0_g1::TRINITY_DN11252_c0_g1_i1::g.167383::m.167383
MRAALVLVALLHSAAAYTEGQWAQFEEKVKYYVKNSTIDDQLAVSVGWVDAKHNFSYAAGLVNETDGTRRRVTPEDTYLYGSGSKVLTSVAVLSLVERGVLSLDDPVSKHVDRLLQLYANTSLVQLWGARGVNVTVRECLHMSSGISDYDNPTFDDWMLVNDSSGVVSPVTFIAYPGKLKQPFVCEPGTCRAYSSTGYVLLGLLLTEHSGQDDWTKVKTSDFFHPAVRARFADKVHFFTDEPLDKWLTVPGLSFTWDTSTGNWTPGPTYSVAKQNSSIVGFTCANSVTNPTGMAEFYHALLHDQTVLQPSTMKEMLSFEILSEGWGKGMIAYGLGMMQGSLNLRDPVPKGFGGWGSYLGHGGMVFGFVSQQSYYWGINASISVVFNADGGLSNRQNDQVLSCQIVEAAANILYEAGIDLDCWNTWM